MMRVIYCRLRTVRGEKVLRRMRDEGPPLLHLSNKRKTTQDGFCEKWVNAEVA